MLVQLYRYWQKNRLGEDIGIGWAHISPTLQLHLYTSRNLREKVLWLWWLVAYTKYSVSLWPKPSLMLWIWTGAKPKKNQTIALGWFIGSLGFTL